MTRHKLILWALAVSGFAWMGHHGDLRAQSSAVTMAQAGPAATQPMTYADLERLYLDGKISAKQYQRLLNEMKSRPAPPPTAPRSSTPGTAAPVQTNRPPVLN